MQDRSAVPGGHRSADHRMLLAHVGSRLYRKRSGIHIYRPWQKQKAKRYIPLTLEAVRILEAQKPISRSNYVFVRFGERVDRELWYVAPISRHTISQQFSQRRDEMGLPWDAVLHSTRHTALTDLALPAQMRLQYKRWLVMRR